MKNIVLNNLNEINITSKETNTYFILDKKSFNNKIICFEFIESNYLENELSYLSIKIENKCIYISKDTLINNDEDINENIMFNKFQYKNLISYSCLEDLFIIRVSNHFFLHNVKVEDMKCNVYIYEKKYNTNIKTCDYIEKQQGFLSLQDIYFNN